MINQQLKEQIKEHIVKTVEARKGEKLDHILTELAVTFMSTKLDEISLAASEAVSERLVKRIEYQLQNEQSNYHAFLIPITARVV